MRRIATRLCVLVALAALAASAAPPAAKKPSGEARKPPTEEQLRELRTRIESLQQRLSAAESSKSEAADQLRESERAVSEAHRALFSLAQKRREIEASIAAVAARQQSIRADSAREEALAGKLLRLQYRQGAPDRLRLALEGRDAATVARHLAYYGYIQKARADLIAGLRRTSSELAALETEARARRDELAGNQAEQADEAKRLEQERAAHAKAVRRLAADIARDRGEIGRLKADEARLSRLVQEIARALATKSAKRAPATGKRIEQVADASLAARPFASLKGRLRLPVRGELSNQYGLAREEGGTTWKGLFIRAVTGETVHAVADGRVVFADWLRGFGNLLILDHGGGFMSLYANNEGLLRQVGETVRSGDPIAQVGASGGHSESGLYFELRRDGKPFDPMRWVAE